MNSPISRSHDFFGYRASDVARAPFGGDGGGFDVFYLAQLTLELETVYQDLKHFVCFDFLHRDR